ncbi:histone deacetylase family protein [Nordella sp. HKS 07]|uniref:histone deacetylase family protein n=1 Tax=Nordella sp. HKS 07 TaxID=2712222 RepID=UPI0013E195A5|nr:histone deacetylase family protein [Nordella sp. HKS 07]QIG49522.1 histone deacetylase family protein [Nordella sp. HKS 07]
MTTLLLHHHSSLAHENPPGHPERVDRIKAINQILSHTHFKPLRRKQAPLARDEDIIRAHPDGYLNLIRETSPDQGYAQIDMDTFMSPGTLEAALRGAGAAVAGVDAVFTGEADNVFCAMRPPGHHAEARRAMGFCLFNNAAIAALYARQRYDAERVAVVDFDVHHGNGTQDIFWADGDLFYGSTHQMPLYPGTGAASETGVGNIFNAPLQDGDGGPQFRSAMSTAILPALDAFGPDLVVISAGFDAHLQDPLGGLNLTEEDFVWATLNLMDIADKHAEGRVVSVLEGGYDIRALAASVAVHVQALIRGSGEPTLFDHEDDADGE